MPQRSQGPDPEEQLETYEKEIHELQTQVKFLEDEVALLRRRLSNAPRQVKVLEEQILQTRSDLMRAAGQNEKLVTALKAEREKIEGLREEVEKLTQPPATFGVYLRENEEGSVDVFTAGRKMRVNVDPEIERARLRQGVEVILNEALNVVEVLDHDVTGEVVTIKELLGPDRAVVVGRGDEEAVALLAVGLRGQVRAGDPLLFDPRSSYALEKLPKEQVEEAILEEIPEITYEDIGGLGKQIEEIRDAVELPFLYSELFRTRGSGISSDVENTIVPQLLSEIDGVETLSNVIVIGASNREDMIDPAILRPGRLDVKIKIERPEADAAGEIMARYLTTDVPIHEDEVQGADRDRAVRRMIERTIERMYATSEENRFLEVTYQSGDKEVLYFKDFNSGAMIENIVSRAKKMAIKRFLKQGEKGLKLDDLLAAIRDEFKENEDLPNTTNPDDWARISGKKGERIVYVRTLLGDTKGSEGRQVERINAGQYL